jgi:hypothetical protein
MFIPGSLCLLCFIIKAAAPLASVLYDNSIVAHNKHINMKNDNKDTDFQEIKADLKHDTMEYSAPSDGNDPLDTDDNSYEEEGITAEELDIIEDKNPAVEAYTLNAAETDRQADDDSFPNEDWEDDLPDDDYDDGEEDDE